MEHMDNVRERIEALAQRREQGHQQTRLAVRRRPWGLSLACGVCLLSLVSLASPSQAADFACTAGDVTCLITGINMANANGEANTLTLEAGIYTLTTVDNTTDGPNGLPSVTSTLTIQGAGANTTVIERVSSAPRFRLLHVAATGGLTLEGLTVRGGWSSSSNDAGGGLFNRGVLALAHTTVSRNMADAGGGLANRGGVMTIAQSTIRENRSGHPGGGIDVEGGLVTILRSTLSDNFADGGGALALNQFTSLSTTVVITESAIVDNASFVQEGGGLVVGSRGVLVATNTTIARNVAFSEGASGVDSSGTSILTNCTVTENSGAFPIGGACSRGNAPEHARGAQYGTRREKCRLFGSGDLPRE